MIGYFHVWCDTFGIQGLSGYGHLNLTTEGQEGQHDAHTPARSFSNVWLRGIQPGDGPTV